MLDRLRSALSDAIKSLASRALRKTITEEDVDEVLEELKLRLLESEVAFEVAEKLAERVKQRLVGLTVERGWDAEKAIASALREALLEVLGRPGPDLVEEAKRRCGGERPLVVVFLGVNGVGKTTTIAKLAYLMKRSGVTPVLAAADTFRAGAQEQIEAHASRLGVPLVKGRYGSDPASVAFNAVEYARARNYCVVLVDTAGRMHVDYDLMGEMRKIVRVVKPDFKVLVVDALTGNDAVEQARRFNEEVGVDGFIITKVDSDVKGGVAVSIAEATGKPILYLGMGQRYEDLQRFDPEKLVDSILPER
ncbi:signal recognition particle-docking protein FtsY [Stetteria hydrogenophila]